MIMNASGFIPRRSSTSDSPERTSEDDGRDSPNVPEMKLPVPSDSNRTREASETKGKKISLGSYELHAATALKKYHEGKSSSLDRGSGDDDSDGQVARKRPRTSRRGSENASKRRGVPVDESLRSNSGDPAFLNIDDAENDHIERRAFGRLRLQQQLATSSALSRVGEMSRLPAALEAAAAARPSLRNPLPVNPDVNNLTALERLVAQDQGFRGLAGLRPEAGLVGVSNQSLASVLEQQAFAAARGVGALGPGVGPSSRTLAAGSMPRGAELAALNSLLLPQQQSQPDPLLRLLGQGDQLRLAASMELARAGLSSSTSSLLHRQSPAEILNRATLREAGLRVPESALGGVGGLTGHLGGIGNQLRGGLDVELQSLLRQPSGSLQMPGTRNPASLVAAAASRGLRSSRGSGDHGVMRGQARMPQQQWPIDPSVPRTLPVPLSLSEDETKLSAYQILLRAQIEAFSASAEDVTTHARGRNRPITLRQVGIRCRHCKHLPQGDRKKGSVYFPFALVGLYQAAQNMGSSHFHGESCDQMPAEIKAKFVDILACKSTVGAGKQYWAKSAQKLGLVDTEQGIRFVRDLRPWN